MRHLVAGVAHQPGPGLVDFQALQLRIYAENVTGQQLPEALFVLQIAGGDMATPKQAITLDDTVVVRGAAVVADGIRGTYHVIQAFTQVFGEYHVSGDRQESSAQSAELGAAVAAAAVHHVGTGDRAVGSGHAVMPGLACYPQHGRLLVDAAAGKLDQLGKAQAVVQRVKMKTMAVAQPLVVAVGVQVAA